MSSILRVLAKVGLVELDESEGRASRKTTSKRGSPSAEPPAGEDEIERILRETQAALAASDSGSPTAAPSSSSPTADPTPAAPPPVPRSAPSGELSAENSLAEIYMVSGVPDSPFPVEKLIKVLEGLQALPVASRKAAVMALDSADDNWSIADVILDAQRKTRALREEQARLDGHLAATDAQAQTDIGAAEAYLEQATSTIREQIAEMETMLQQEVQQVADQKAEITLTLQSNRDAAAHQRARLENEIVRIAKIPLTFGDVAS